MVLTFNQNHLSHQNVHSGVIVHYQTIDDYWKDCEFSLIFARYINQEEFHRSFSSVKQNHAFQSIAQSPSQFLKLIFLIIAAFNNSRQMFPALYFFYFSSLIPLLMAAGPQCNTAEQSVSGKALKGHTYKTKRVQCNAICKICELNDRTNEEKPDDFVHDGTRFYVRKWKNRGRHISALEPIRARSYFKCLRRYRSFTQRAMQMAMSVLCCIFEAIHHGIALRP